MNWMGRSSEENCAEWLPAEHQGGWYFHLLRLRGRIFCIEKSKYSFQVYCIWDVYCISKWRWWVGLWLYTYRAQESVEGWSWKCGICNLEMVFKNLKLGRFTSSMAENAPVRLAIPQIRAKSSRQNTKNSYIRLCKVNESRQILERNC